MASDDSDHTRLTGAGRSSSRKRRIARRPMVKAGAAIAGGVGLGAVYIKPGMLSVSVMEVYAVTPLASNPSADVDKTISGVKLANPIEIKGSIKLTNATDDTANDAIEVVGFLDNVEYRIGGGSWTNVASFSSESTATPGISFAFSAANSSSDTTVGSGGKLVGTVIQDKDDYATFNYIVKLTSGTIPSKATAVRNEIVITLKGREKQFTARDSFEFIR